MASPDTIDGRWGPVHEGSVGDAVWALRRLRCSEQAAAGRVAAADLMAYLGLSDVLDHHDRAFFACRGIRQGEVPVRTGDPCQYLYVVLGGSLAVRLIETDGTERVIGFQRTGDTLGLDGLATGHYASESVALEAGILAIIPLGGQGRGGQHVHRLPTFVRQLLGRQIIRDKATLAVMAATHALARLGAFLLDWHERSADDGPSFELPMSRSAIASFLGVSRETISRACADLGRAGIVTVRGSRFTIVDADALRRTAAAAMMPCHHHGREALAGRMKPNTEVRELQAH
ncbi:MAG: Crp/Fnr family transcriptional regulator [Rhodocyclaceae bacterium]|nr:Crp/Fnr family transcriptional regulator [Rhodocyclaceae bacterium]